MKKLLAVFLVFLIIGITGAQLLIFGVYKFMIRKEAKSYLKNTPDRELDSLVFKLSDFDHGYPFQKIKSDEILYRGNMYDVKSISVEGNDIVFLVFHDKKEKAWMDNWYRCCGHNSSTSKNIALVTRLSLIFVSSTNGTQQTWQVLYVPVGFCVRQNLFTSAVKLDVPYPPPEV